MAVAVGLLLLMTSAKRAEGDLTLEASVAPAPPKGNGKLVLSATNVDGLKYTLELRPADKRAFAFGEVVQMVLNVRNPGTVATTKMFSTRDFYAAAFTVVDAAGKTIDVVPPAELFGNWAILKKTIPPEETTALSPVQLVFQPADAPRAKAPNVSTVYAPPGKYKVSYPGTEPVEVEIK